LGNRRQIFEALASKLYRKAYIFKVESMDLCQSQRSFYIKALKFPSLSVAIAVESHATINENATTTTTTTTRIWDADADQRFIGHQ